MQLTGLSEIRNQLIFNIINIWHAICFMVVGLNACPLITEVTAGLERQLFITVKKEIP